MHSSKVVGYIGYKGSSGNNRGNGESDRGARRDVGETAGPTHEEDPSIDRNDHDPEYSTQRRFDQRTSGLTRMKMDRWQTSLSVLVFAAKVFASTTTDEDDPCVFILL